MFEGQPKGLYALALANTGERFGYYTMLAIFTLFLQAKFGYTAAETIVVICYGFVNLQNNNLQNITLNDTIIIRHVSKIATTNR